jgi:hypothetical protein
MVSEPSIEYFEFERDFISTWRCIPMSVRLKLDTCGLKLKLQEWMALSVEERTELVTTNANSPAEVAMYGQRLQEMVIAHLGVGVKEMTIDPQPPWLDETNIPPAVIDRATTEGADLNPSRWQQLSPLQRFALIKLTRSNHENNNFLPAIVEFGIPVARTSPPTI